MLSLDIRRISLTSLLLMLVLILSSCSGTGGTSSSSSQLNTGSSTATATLTIAAPVLQFSQSTTVTASFKKSDGTPASSIPVTFATTLGTLTPASGVATTDASGSATVQLTAGTGSGQGQITANATVDNKIHNLSAIFSINLPALKLANLTLTSNPNGVIDFGSSQGISVDIQNTDGTPFVSQAVDVVFTSVQASQGKASFTAPTTVNGKATTTYSAATALGVDVITASIAGSSITVPITVNALNAGSLSYQSAAPLSIGLKGMGGLGVQETSKVTFKVVDTSGNPKSNQPVTFVLSTFLGGLSLSANSGSTGSDGTVSTIVQAGVIATPVRVMASTVVNGNTLSTQSDQLVVSTGIPAQDAYSVSFSNQNSESFSHDGVTMGVTVRLADHFHNPVPDGTAVYFTTTGGSIAPSCVTTKGTCTAQWTSQDPRPANGRFVILSYAVGEEAFTDSNGSGYADAGEFVPDTVAFRDDNFHCTPQVLYPSIKACVTAESLPWYDFNAGSNSWSIGALHAFPNPDSGYIGILQGVDASGTPYSSRTPATPRLKHVFKNSQMVMSTDGAIIKFSAVTAPLAGGVGSIEVAPVSAPAAVTLTGPGRFRVTVTDLNGNTMAAGTTIAVVAPYGVLSGNTSITVPQNIGSGQILDLLLAATTSSAPQSAGFITVTVTSPGGLITTGYIPVVGTF